MQTSGTVFRSRTKHSVRFVYNIIRIFLVTLSKKFRTLVKRNNLHVHGLTPFSPRPTNFQLTADYPAFFPHTYCRLFQHSLFMEHKFYSLSADYSTKFGQNLRHKIRPVFQQNSTVLMHKSDITYHISARKNVVTSGWTPQAAWQTVRKRTIRAALSRCE